MIGSVNRFIATALVLIMSLSNATYAYAQSSPDTRSPLIELETVAEASADATQVFTAQVVDDRILKDVILYHRREGQQAFTPVTMQPIGDSAYFTASVETDPEDLRAIQYYVQARDEGGNRTVQGYAFDPYTRDLISNNAVINTQAIAPVKKASSRRGVKWWQIVLGVVAVGALASAVGGSGGDGSDDGTVPLTVTATGL